MRCSLNVATPCMDVAWKSYTSVFKDAHCPRIWAAITYAYTLMPLVAGHGSTEHLQSRRKHLQSRRKQAPETKSPEAKRKPEVGKTPELPKISPEEKPDTIYEMANSDLLVVYKNIC